MWNPFKIDKVSKEVIKKQAMKAATEAIILIIFFGGSMMFYVHKVQAANNLDYRNIVGVTAGSQPNAIFGVRYEITEEKDKIAAFNISIKWSDNITEDYGEFKLFLGSPLQMTKGDGWYNITTVVYYSPLQTVKAENNVKLIVIPKKARIRGDPTFYRGIDYNNGTRLAQLHIITDAVMYDVETNKLTYNFVVSGIGSSYSSNQSVSNIIIQGPLAHIADIP